MELWIRSQDRMLLIKPITVGAYYFNSSKKATIRVKDDDLPSTAVGLYNSMGRALEVLDEIQELFEPTTITMDGQYMETRQLDTFVYEMPEE